jgi:hypothetical protein
MDSPVGHEATRRTHAALTPQEMLAMTFRSLAPVFALALTTVAIPALAQEQDRSNASYATEASITYSLLRDVGETGKAGMAVDFGKQLTSHLSAIGEISLNHFSTFEETYTQFSGGVRFGSVVNGRIRPFAQVLVGIQRDFGSNGFNVQPGAGLNIRVARKLDARVQLDAPLVRWEGENYKQFRFIAGVGLPLGR